MSLLVNGHSHSLAGLQGCYSNICMCMLVLGCRDTTSGGRFVQQLRREGVSGGKTEVMELDLQSYASVRAFAKQVSDKNLPIHVLVNNGKLLPIEKH